MRREAPTERWTGILELVMAMGWTRAGLVAQDIANGLVWKLLRTVDAEAAEYVANM